MRWSTSAHWKGSARKGFSAQKGGQGIVECWWFGGIWQGWGLKGCMVHKRGVGLIHLRSSSSCKGHSDQFPTIWCPGGGWGRGLPSLANATANAYRLGCQRAWPPRFRLPGQRSAFAPDLHSRPFPPIPALAAGGLTWQVLLHLADNQARAPSRGRAGPRGWGGGGLGLCRGRRCRGSSSSGWSARRWRAPTRISRPSSGSTPLATWSLAGAAARSGGTVQGSPPTVGS